MKEERYARVCDVTGQGMNEGWCWGDGSFYTATKEDTIAELRQDIKNGAYSDVIPLESLSEFLALTEDDLFSWGYDNEVFYWTEWYDEELEEGDTYFDKEGNEHEIKNLELMKKITEQQQEIINSLMYEFNRINKTVKSKESFNFIDIEPLIDKTREIENNNAIIKADTEAWVKLAIEEADRLVVLFQKDLPNLCVRRMGKETGHYEDSVIIIHKNEESSRCGGLRVSIRVKVRTEVNLYLSHSMRFDKGKGFFYMNYGGDTTTYSSVEELIKETDIAEEIRRLM